MAVVIVSAARFSRGEEIAARVAELLGYRVVGREVFETAAARYGASRKMLAQAVDGRVTWRVMPANERRVCLAYLEAALYEHIRRDGCVCHGLAAHLYVNGISHVVKVRVKVPVEARIREAERRLDIGEVKADKMVRRLDARRERWVSDLYGVDEDAPALFDLTIDREETTVEEAAALVAECALENRFRPMSYSLGRARDRELASRVRAELVDVDPEVRVQVNDRVVHIEATDEAGRGRKAHVLEERARAVADVEKVEVTLIEDVFARAAVSMR